MAPKSPLLTVQYLRAIAALMVAYFHTPGQIESFVPYFNKYLFASEELSSGVDIFFVISGFIMLISNQNSTPRAFMIRRLIRVVPLYWVLTTFVVIAAVARPELFKTTVVTPISYLKSLAFIPYANPGHGGDVVPLLVPGWSLNLEMFFYCIFAVLLFLPLSRRVPIMGAIFCLLVLSTYVLAGPQSSSILSFLGNPRVFEFWLGMCIAHFYLRGQMHFRLWIPPLFLIGGFTALLWAKDLVGVPQDAFLRTLLLNALPAAAILFGAVALEQSAKVQKSDVLMYLGDISYSIYLSHILSLGVARLVWQRLGLEQTGLAFAAGFAVFAVILMILGAALTYKFLEKPLLNAFQHRVLRVIPH